MDNTENKIADFFYKEFSKLADNLVCWGFAAGRGTGSMVTLYFGGKRLRNRPIHNLSLSEDVRKYQGEYCLFLKDCEWRIQTSDEVIASSVSSNEKGGAMLSALDRLVGEYVVSAEVNRPCFDLRIGFGNGINLIVFCLGGSDEELDNYTFFSGHGYYVSKFNGLFEKRERKRS